MKNNISIIANKELKEYFINKKFIVILCLILLIGLYGIISGINYYNQILTGYKNDEGSQTVNQIIMDSEKEIQQAKESGASLDSIQMMEYSLDLVKNPIMPSVLTIFNKMYVYYLYIGMLFSVLIGHNLITKEKEDGTIKSMLSRPLFRDELINGKILGSLGILSLVIGLTMIIMLGLLLIYGIIPTLEELFKIVVFYVTILLYCMVFLGFSIMVSGFAKNSSVALLYCIFIIVIFAAIPILFYTGGSYIVLGNPPDTYYQSNNGSWYEDTTQYNLYMTRYKMTSDLVDAITPMNNFEKISDSLLLDKWKNAQYSLIQGKIFKEVSFSDTLLSLAVNYIGLIVYIIIGYSIAYIKFMRIDL